MNNNEEVWVEAFNFPNYEVSNLGNIRNAKTQQVIKLGFDGSKYRMARIYYNGKKYTKRVAKMIWQSFNNCECKQTIDHRDRNSFNDKIENLRCVSFRYNIDNKKYDWGANKYGLTNEMKGLIAYNYINKIWSTWDIMKEYKIPINYIQTTMKRGSWIKHIPNV